VDGKRRKRSVVIVIEAEDRIIVERDRRWVGVEY